MGQLENRIAKLEAVHQDASTICKCPNAVRYVGSEWAKTCYRCMKTLDMKTWGHWDVILPRLNEKTGEVEGPDFAMARNDSKEVREYKFHPEPSNEVYW